MAKVSSPLAEFRKDYRLYKDLEPIAAQIEELAESVQKAMMALSSDIMAPAASISAHASTS